MQHLHEKLGITFQELVSLLGTRELLVRNLVKHVSDSLEIEHEHLFNMNFCGKQRDCGTIGCIGGYMAMVMGVTDEDGINRYVDITRSSSLGKLFFPSLAEHQEYDSISTEQAVQAIDNFLAGKAPWKFLAEEAPWEFLIEDSDVLM